MNYSANLYILVSVPSLGSCLPVNILLIEPIVLVPVYFLYAKNDFIFSTLPFTSFFYLKFSAILKYWITEPTISADIVAGSSNYLVKYWGIRAKEVPSGDVSTFLFIPTSSFFTVAASNK